MTKREAMRRTMQDDALRALGFTQDEAEKLRRISLTLHRWHELECGTDGGCIERDEKTGKPFFVRTVMGGHTRAGREYVTYRHAIPDRETGALNRLKAIIGQRNKRAVEAAVTDKSITANVGKISVNAYIQTDPRGAALYIIRPGDVPEGGNAESYYSRGLVVY